MGSNCRPVVRGAYYKFVKNSSEARMVAITCKSVCPAVNSSLGGGQAG